MHQERLRRICSAMCLTPTPRLGVNSGLVRTRRWTLVGGVEGDAGLPMTAGAKDIDDALEHVEGWLAPQIDCKPDIALAVVVRDGKVLILQLKDITRNDAPSRNLPGTFIECQETAKEAALRGLKEKAGLDGTNPTYLLSAVIENGESQRSWSPKHGIHYEVWAFEVPDDAHITLSLESDKFGWYRWDDRPRGTGPILTKVLMGYRDLRTGNVTC